MSKSWRDMARPIIHRVLEENKGKDDKEIRKALRKAYPWYERSMHPYKIWLDEIKVQTGHRTFGHQSSKPNPDQTFLF